MRSMHPRAHCAGSRCLLPSRARSGSSHCHNSIIFCLRKECRKLPTESESCECGVPIWKSLDRCICGYIANMHSPDCLTCSTAAGFRLVSVPKAFVQEEVVKRDQSYGTKIVSQVVCLREQFSRRRPRERVRAAGSSRAVLPPEIPRRHDSPESQKCQYIM
jgi:hypothetical protein